MVHTRRAGKPEVQGLFHANLFHVEEIPRPNQTPRCVPQNGITAQVGVGVRRTRAVSDALSRALIEAYVPNVHELVKNLHPGQVHEMVRTSALQCFLSPASSGEVEDVDKLESIEAPTSWGNRHVVAVT